MGTALTKVESKKLDAQLDIVRNGIVTFFEVGKALKTIRDETLYRETFSTFEDACQHWFGYERRHSYRLIESFDVRDNLCPMGHILPTNERQIRPLTRLEPEQQREAWQEVLDRAPETEDGHKLITAKVVSEVVSEMFPKETNNDHPFDRHEEGDKLRDLMRNRLERWPEDFRTEAAHWIRQVLREFGL